MFQGRSNFHIWRTEPKQGLLYKVIWFLLKLLWEPFSLKRSHWWHWQLRDLPENAKKLTVKGDGVSEERNSFWSNFWQSNFGWQKVVILAPTKSQKIKGLEFHVDSFCYVQENIGPFLFGWNQDGNKKFQDNKFEICTIVQNIPPRFGVLVGPRDANFFAFDLEGNPLELVDCGTVTKEEALQRSFDIY